MLTIDQSCNLNMPETLLHIPGYSWQESLMYIQVAWLLICFLYCWFGIKGESKFGRLVPVSKNENVQVVFQNWGRLFLLLPMKFGNSINTAMSFLVLFQHLPIKPKMSTVCVSNTTTPTAKQQLYQISSCSDMVQYILIRFKQVIVYIAHTFAFCWTWKWQSRTESLWWWIMGTR